MAYLLDPKIGNQDGYVKYNIAIVKRDRFRIMTGIKSDYDPLSDYTW